MPTTSESITIAGIVAAILGLLAACMEFTKRSIDLGPVLRYQRQRIDALPGFWKGTFLQPDHPFIPSGEITGNLRCTRKRVIADFKLSIKVPNQSGTTVSEEIISVKGSGGIVRQNFLKLDYANADGSVNQFGTMWFKLDDTGRFLTGRFVGYGHHAKSLLVGICTLNK